MSDKYLVTFWSADSDEIESVEAMYEPELFKLLNTEGDATVADGRRKFTVETVGKCVIDWS